MAPWIHKVDEAALDARVQVPQTNTSSLLRHFFFSLNYIMCTVSFHDAKKERQYSILEMNKQQTYEKLLTWWLSKINIPEWNKPARFRRRQTIMKGTHWKQFCFACIQFQTQLKMVHGGSLSTGLKRLEITEEYFVEITEEYSAEIRGNSFLNLWGSSLEQWVGLSKPRMPQVQLILIQPHSDGLFRLQVEISAALRNKNTPVHKLTVKVRLLKQWRDGG